MNKFGVMSTGFPISNSVSATFSDGSTYLIRFGCVWTVPLDLRETVAGDTVRFPSFL